jgi:hypothetical protein
VAQGNVAERVRLCASCHIGDATRDVNHDLIAAGHPRLLFEYSAYHDLMPRHWPAEAKGSEAKAWLVGQVASARAAVELLRARAQKARPWPEFAETSCSACHHDLGGTGRQPTDNAKVTMPWANWYTTGPEALARLSIPKPAGVNEQLFKQLRTVMSSPRPDLKQVVCEADCVIDSLSSWLCELRCETVTADSAADWQRRWIADAKLTTVPDWESACQRYLGVAALEKARCGLTGEHLRDDRRRGLEELRGLLRFPCDRDGPRLEFTPEKAIKQLCKLPALP